MKSLTLQQKTYLKKTTICITCQQPFTQSNHKVHHHYHVTGDYISPACSSCNLQIKARHSSAGRFGEARENFFVPVVAHNLKNYDTHLTLEHFQRDDAKQNTKSEIKVIYLNSK